MDAHPLSKICFFLGIISVFISLVIWSQAKARPTEDKARAERFALFVGLWAPSLFALASYFKGVARL